MLLINNSSLYYSITADKNLLNTLSAKFSSVKSDEIFNRRLLQRTNFVTDENFNRLKFITDEALTGKVHLIL